MNRKKLLLLNPREYEHEFDSKALKTLEGTPGLELLTRKVYKMGIERYYRILQTGSYIRATPDNFPDIYQILEEACANIYLTEIPELYIQWGYEINAMAIGSENPIITVFSGAIDLLSTDELLYIIGHECGHIKSGHMLYHTMASVLPYLGNVIGSMTLGIGSYISMGVEYALLYWQRMSELTADRAGFLACQDKEIALNSLMKMSGVPKNFYDQMNTEDFIEQAKTFKGFDYDSADKVFKIALAMSRTHPWTVMRASEILKWENSGKYQKIIDKHTGDLSSLELTCFKCGFRLTGIEIFCGNCGAKLAQR